MWPYLKKLSNLSLTITLRTANRRQGGIVCKLSRNTYAYWLSASLAQQWLRLLLPYLRVICLSKVSMGLTSECGTTTANADQQARLDALSSESQLWNQPKNLESRP